MGSPWIDCGASYGCAVRCAWQRRVRRGDAPCALASRGESVPSAARRNANKQCGEAQAKTGSATSRSPLHLSLGPESNAVAGSGASSNAISGHFEQALALCKAALLRLSRPPADPDVGRTPSPQPIEQIQSCPSAAAAPGRHKTALDTRGAVEPRAVAANPQSPRARSRREPPSLSPRAKRGTAPWRPRAAASSRPRSPT